MQQDGGMMERRSKNEGEMERTDLRWKDATENVDRERRGKQHSLDGDKKKGQHERVSGH